MNKQPLESDIIIAGGGPVGLYLAGSLGKMGYQVIVLEKKSEIDLHSKSLGIHPISMELFDEAGIADRFVNNGIQIQKGIACLDQKKIGEIDFQSCTRPFNFILALPQYRTEQILEKWVIEFDTVQLIRGAEVVAIDQSESHVSVTFSKESSTLKARSQYLAGCDGKNSIVRKSAGIEFLSKKYPDTYIMGDFSDNTGFGTNAVVFLHRDGLIESFPLPKNYRRWVVKTDNYFENPTREMLDALILNRLDHNMNHEKNSMISSFGVQHELAEKFHSGRIALAGDSAHVVSPIGGQGMNLGWLTAKNLADTLKICIEKPDRARYALEVFTKASRKKAKKVARRAELNMWLGQKRRFPLIRNLIARLMVSPPLNRKMAEIFTMRRL
ncbi:NAD(P)/FAD-dependent oxidoreductase [soil metagenome]